MPASETNGNGETSCSGCCAGIAALFGKKGDAVPVPKAFYSRPGKGPCVGKKGYEADWKRSVANKESFWSEIAEGFHWEVPFDKSKVFTTNFDSSKGPVKNTWFAGGKTNICYNCLDRNVANGLGGQVAFYAERNDIGEEAPQKEVWTYAETLEETCRLANVLKGQGVGEGDRVAIFMPMVPEAVVAMHACARLGAIHTVVFGGFSPAALASRLDDSEAKVVIACDGVGRGAKNIDLFGIYAESLGLAEKKSVQAGIILQRLGPHKLRASLKPGRDIWWHDALASASTTCPPVWVDAEAPLFILYTSGSTGKPKGVLHTTGGYMVGSATSFRYAFDVRKGEVWFCTADVGWITGHSYVAYSPMLNSATQVIFEGVPTHPDGGRLWDIVDKYKVTHLYTAPTAIRSLMGLGNDIVKKRNRSSLKLLGSVGEPINPEAWRWYQSVVGDERCPVSDTWWQTETGAIMICPMPVRGLDQKPGSAMTPLPGVQPVVLDTEGKEKPWKRGQEIEGLLAIKEPWPSMSRTLWGDQKRFEEVYYPLKGYYLTGDGCRRDKDGHYWITGRVDDVIIVSGHNIGTAEVESALVLHESVSEAAVVGIPDDIKGNSIYAYVTLMKGVEPTDSLKVELRKLTRKTCGSFVSPDTIHWAPALPKTRSGKIMRRILRKIAERGPEVDMKELGDTSTLADPSVVDNLIATHALSKQ